MGSPYPLGTPRGGNPLSCIVALFAAGLIFVVSLSGTVYGAPSGATPVVRGVNAFALELYGALRDAPGNLVFSPFSIASALAMTGAGAADSTAAEFTHVLHVDVAGTDAHRQYGELLALLDREDGTLTIANRLWGDAKDVLPEFRKLIRTRYRADLETADFGVDPEAARRRVNDWVDEATRGKIHDILAPGTLDDLTRLVLTNAIYFHESWKSRFDAQQTADLLFRITRGRQVRVPMMTQRGTFSYRRLADAALLELPYAGGTREMVVLLPDSTDGLPALERRLEPDSLYGWLRLPDRREVDVFLPRFHLETRSTLKEPLRSLGLDRAFHLPEADFSRVNGRRDLYLKLVAHQAMVDVDERGTEAAASSIAVLRTLGYASRNAAPLFYADHPFLFLIRDTRTGLFLFIGRVADPSSS